MRRKAALGTDTDPKMRKTSQFKFVQEIIVEGHGSLVQSLSNSALLLSISNDLSRFVNAMLQLLNVFQL